VGTIELNRRNHEAAGLFAQITIADDWVQSLEHERTELATLRDGLGPAECDEPIGLGFRSHWCLLREPCCGSD
jgi:hypothetical protein